MSDNKRMFPYEKAIVLNALYDSLDALSFIIDSSNSVRGTLLVSSASFSERKGRVAIPPTLSVRETFVEVFSDEGDIKQAEWIGALMDETQVLIRNAEAQAIK